MQTKEPVPGHDFTTRRSYYYSSPIRSIMTPSEKNVTPTEQRPRSLLLKKWE